uniref:LRRCT domain-containing protein n=1 Tax=Branchiostoma floridae TaxID=7739 RepID=C3YNS3_BRAFL|eukprot:XP_002602021.1 hypothetical protein BRAFLDRAFT_82609 [Branchiostoma floridae]
MHKPYPFHELFGWAVLMKRQKMALFFWKQGEEALAKFHELFGWAVLMKRQKMALFFWKQGEEALAKLFGWAVLMKRQKMALFFWKQGEEALAKNLALQLLDHCYRQDDTKAMQLLTYELKYWSKQTCLSLAVAANHREFIAHTCCQVLLSDMWMGGLQMRKSSGLKVLLSDMWMGGLQMRKSSGLKVRPEVCLFVCLFVNHREFIAHTCCQVLLSDMWMGGLQMRKSSGLKVRPECLFVCLFVCLNHREFIAHTCCQVLLSDMWMGGLQMRKSSGLKVLLSDMWMGGLQMRKSSGLKMAYVVFLMLFNYVVLERTGPFPGWEEWYIIAYIVTLAVEKVREILVSEPSKLTQKFWVWWDDNWNRCDTIAILAFLVGVGLRFHDNTIPYGRVLYCVDIIFWYIRLLDILSVNKYLGPYVMMIGKMMVDMLYFVIIMLIVLMSFGVARQAIRHPDEDPSWTSAKNIFLEPYFMLYGEVYAGSIDRKYSPTVWGGVCSIDRKYSPTVWGGVCRLHRSNTFSQIKTISNQVWRFQRFHLIMEYEQRPMLPMPLTILYHIYMLLKYLVCVCSRCRHNNLYSDKGLKLFLSDDDVERLHDFEEECVEEYFREKEDAYGSSTNERIRMTQDRVEHMSMRVDEVHEKEGAVKVSLTSLDQRLARLENVSAVTTTTLQRLEMYLSRLDSQASSLANIQGKELYLFVCLCVRRNHDNAPAAGDVSLPARQPSIQPRQHPGSGSVSGIERLAVGQSGLGSPPAVRRRPGAGQKMPSDPVTLTHASRAAAPEHRGSPDHRRSKEHRGSQGSKDMLPKFYIGGSISDDEDDAPTPSSQIPLLPTQRVRHESSDVSTDDGSTLSSRFHRQKSISTEDIARCSPRRTKPAFHPEDPIISSIVNTRPVQGQYTSITDSIDITCLSDHSNHSQSPLSPIELPRFPKDFKFDMAKYSAENHAEGEDTQTAIRRAEESDIELSELANRTWKLSNDSTPRLRNNSIYQWLRRSRPAAMPVRSLLPVALLLLALPRPCVRACPASCRCLDGADRVHCEAKSLTRVPHSIPFNTRRLFLDSNKIAEVTSGDFVGLGSLTQLYFTANHITRIAYGAFSTLSRLTYLDVTHNRMSAIRSGMFVGLTSLKRLILSSNTIRNIDDGAFNDLTSIENLDLSNNAMSVVNSGMFVGLHNLKNLDMSYNNISIVRSNTFRHLVNLSFLNLNNNRLTNIKPKTFVGLEVLDNLRLEQNRIVKITNGAFRPLEKLSTLSLRSNRLKTVTSGMLDGLENLNQLELFINRISRIEDGAFGHLVNLRILWLDWNKMSEVSPLTFSGLTKLDSLTLNNNNLSRIRAGVFDALPSLTKVRLTSNPWNCNCGLVEMWNWMKETNITYKTPRCASPPALKDVPIANVSLAEFDCVPTEQPDVTTLPTDWHGGNSTSSAPGGITVLGAGRWGLTGLVVVWAVAFIPLL